MESWMVFMIVATAVTSLFGGLGFAFWFQQHQRKLVNRKISDQRVIEMARDNGNKINVAHLCEQTGLSAAEARIKLQYLQENGVLSKDWKQYLSGGGAYVLAGNGLAGFENIVGRLMDKNEWVKKIGLGEVFNSSKNQSNSPSGFQNKDAQIISLALESQGTVSASSVCVKLNISIEEAQRRLEDLCKRQIFITNVNQNGGLVYQLLDN